MEAIFKWAFFMACLQQVTPIHIDLTPNFFVEAATTEVTITCVPDGTGVLAKEILLIEISKNGETPIVNVQPPSKLNYGPNDFQHFEAQGFINNSYVADSYLYLRIKYPTKDDAGAYTCVMSYLDSAGLLKQDRDKADLILHKGDNSSIEDKMDTLQKSLENLLDRVQEVERANQMLIAENRNQSQQLQDLREKVRLTVAFSAAVNQEKNIVSGDTIVFTDVMLNDGQGYNETTGIFTAPVAGLYAFHLVLEIGQGGAVGEVFLNVAGKDMVKMYTQDKDFGDQGAVSVVNKLNKGDAAKAVVHQAAGITPRILSERLCVFSGVLIRS
ncbi:uncharacterized protein LOC106068713 [Biomphalaria glabrata]|uniref:Uncharacterized protein LOC106068713 n=1 Tax=Biomphalaria glabrata TaxID=6526 RepID=A0A9W3A8T5_BIOGL|nr:uncharacterized protein LOC106068713 [Biomphalaria glabrata]